MPPVIRLTPRLLARLRAMAAAEGAELRTFPPEAHAELAFVAADSLEADAQPIVWLAQAVDVSRFRAVRPPGRPVASIPLDRIYDFILAHELSHVRHQDQQTCLRAARTLSASEAAAVCAACEERAEAEAWLVVDVP